MAQPDIDALFAETLLGDYDKPWKAVQSLRRIGTREVFNKAAAWTESVEPLERARGLDVIAQLGKTGGVVAPGLREGVAGAVLRYGSTRS